jgi:hypothetical protein
MDHGRVQRVLAYKNKPSKIAVPQLLNSKFSFPTDLTPKTVKDTLRSGSTATLT